MYTSFLACVIYFIALTSALPQPKGDCDDASNPTGTILGSSSVTTATANTNLKEVSNTNSTALSKTNIKQANVENASGNLTTASAPSVNPSTPVQVSRGGSPTNFLVPTAAAEANQRDNTATRAFTSVQLKSADGRCLFVDPTAGDFREELIPIQMQPCTAAPNEMFDFITKGNHNDADGATLIVSSLMQGCLNFDSRRAAGDTVIMFSCGGRADGVSGTTDSQLFPFTAGATSIVLAPEAGKGQTCLAPNGAKLDSTPCTGGADQQFSIVAGGA